MVIALSVLVPRLQSAPDRLTHRCRILETKGESYRLQDAKTSQWVVPINFGCHLIKRLIIYCLLGGQELAPLVLLLTVKYDPSIKPVRGLSWYAAGRVRGGRCQLNLGGHNCMSANNLRKFLSAGDLD